jgi:hypothetical protein
MTGAIDRSTMGKMPKRSVDGGGRDTVRYRIVIRGSVGPPLVGPLEGLTVESTGDESVLIADIIDQAHFQGVITSLHDRGIEIISINAA